MNGFQDEKTPAAILEILVPRSLPIVAPHSPIPTPAPLQKLSTGQKTALSPQILPIPYWLLPFPCLFTASSIALAARRSRPSAVS